MGLIVVRKNATLVFEAVEPVKLTPLADWIDRGKNDRFVVKRLVNADSLLTLEVQSRMVALGWILWFNKEST